MNVTHEEVFAMVANAAISSDVSAIKGDTVLSDVGIDSLEMMDVLLQIEEKFAIKIPDTDIDALDTVDNIVNYLQKR